MYRILRTKDVFIQDFLEILKRRVLKNIFLLLVALNELRTMHGWNLIPRLPRVNLSYKAKYIEQDVTK